jgi:DNA polymerase-1
MTRTVIIDADVLVYKASEASQELFDIHTHEDDNAIYRNVGWGNKKRAIEVIEKKIDKIVTHTQSTDIYLALSDAEHNFRKDILPSYKGHRKTVKPILYSFLRQYFHDNYKTYERPTLEGDDIIGILATSEKIIKGEKVVWSLDKDLSTIPCIYFKETPNGEIKKNVISEVQADWYFMYQTLTGDVTDGYKGCKDIATTRARRYLDTPGTFTLEEMWKMVVRMYEKNDMTAQDALNNARCARILRCEDYDFKNKEVKLWQI